MRPIGRAGDAGAESVDQMAGKSRFTSTAVRNRCESGSPGESDSHTPLPRGLGDANRAGEARRAASGSAR